MNHSAQPTEPFSEPESHPLRALVDNLPINLVLTDRQGRVTFGNALYLKTTGRTLAEVIGKTDFDLFPEALAKKYWRDTRKVMETGEVFEDVEQHRSPKGDNLYVQVLKTPLRDDRGAISGIQILFWDVTEREQAKAARKRIEEQLRDSQALYQSLVENLPANLVRKDLEGRITFGNVAFLKTMGKTAAEILGQTDFDLFPEALAKKYRQDDCRVLNTGGVFEDIEQLRTPAGEELFIQVLKTPMRDAQGTITGLQVLFWDVTERERMKQELARERDRLRQAHDELEQRVAERTAALSQANAALQVQIAERERAERELAREHDLLRSLMDNIPDSVYFKDLQSRFVKTSRSLASMMGASCPKELKGKTDFDLFDRAHAQPAYNDEQRIISTGEPLVGVVEKEVWKDGSVTWVLTSKMPWRNEKGEIIGTFGISKSITQLKQAELEIERTHRQLLEVSHSAGMAEIATGVLHNVGNVLNSVNVAANLIADKTKNSRISSLAKLDDLLNQHTDDLPDFITRDDRGRRIPSFVKSLSERLRQERAEVLEEVASLTKNIDHIKEIVAVQQDYARASGLMETLPLRELVEDALRIHAEAYTRHGVRLIREFQELPPVTVDKHKVLQILINLLSNAKYACDADAKDEKLVWVRIEGDANRARVIVRDNGVGITSENLINIFQHGFTTRQGGHGFGLHNCANTAKELGGSLVARSDGLGQGASFILELPLRAEKNSKTAP